MKLEKNFSSVFEKLGAPEGTVTLPVSHYSVGFSLEVFV
jgi:hypothetical protein